jgi:hypothetical protein
MIFPCIFRSFHIFSARSSIHLPPGKATIYNIPRVPHMPIAPTVCNIEDGPEIYPHASPATTTILHRMVIGPKACRLYRISSRSVLSGLTFYNIVKAKGRLHSRFLRLFLCPFSRPRLLGKNPRNHGRKNGSICVFAPKTDAV